MDKSVSGISTKKSMLPLILPGDDVFVEKKRKINLNDIIVFRHKGELVAHRVLYIDPESKKIITKGDNNKKVDGKISEKKVLGKINKVKRNGDTVYLKHQYLSQSSSYLKELEDVEKNLEEKGVDHIFLKGLPLYLHFFDKPPRKLYFDADLLIKKKDFKKAKTILKNLGFKKVREKLHGKRVKNPTQTNFFKDEGPFPVVIDLHLEPAVGFTKVKRLNKLGPSGQKLSKYFFTRKRMVDIGGVKFPLLKDETLITYLLLHLYHHNFNGPHRINFLAEIIKKQKTDWDKLASEVRKLGVSNYTYPSMLVVNRLYKNTFPKKILSQTKPEGLLKTYLAKFVSSSINPFNEQSKEVERFKRFVFLLMFSDKDISDRVNIILDQRNLSYAYNSIKSFFSRSLTNSL